MHYTEFPYKNISTVYYDWYNEIHHFYFSNHRYQKDKKNNNTKMFPSNPILEEISRLKEKEYQQKQSKVTISCKGTPEPIARLSLYIL